MPPLISKSRAVAEIRARQARELQTMLDESRRSRSAAGRLYPKNVKAAKPKASKQPRSSQRARRLWVNLE